MIDDIRRNGNAEAWSRDDLTKVFPNGNYRSKWYTIDRGQSPFAAVGIHGQWIYVDPANETVRPRFLAAIADGSWPRSHVAAWLSRDSNQAG